jgi:hypothetical protein
MISSNYVPGLGQVKMTELHYQLCRYISCCLGCFLFSQTAVIYPGNCRAVWLMLEIAVFVDNKTTIPHRGFTDIFNYVLQTLFASDSKMVGLFQKI